MSTDALGPGSLSSACTGHSPFSFVVVMILPQEKGTLGWVGGKSGASFSPAGCWARLPCFHQIPAKGPNQKNQPNKRARKQMQMNPNDGISDTVHFNFRPSLWVGDFRSRENVSGLSNWGLKEFCLTCYISLYIVEMGNFDFFVSEKLWLKHLSSIPSAIFLAMVFICYR